MKFTDSNSNRTDSSGRSKNSVEHELSIEYKLHDEHERNNFGDLDNLEKYECKLNVEHE